MILAKKRTKLSNGVTAIEKVTQYQYKDKISYFYYADLNRGSINICGNGSEKISEEKAMQLVKELKK